MKHTHARLLAAGFGIVCTGGIAEAQSPAPIAPAFAEGADRGDNVACTSGLRLGRMAPAAVYVAVDVPTDTAALRARPAAQQLVAQMAHRIRADFGTRGDSLARAEPRIRWPGAVGRLHVTAHRDGRLTWSAPQGDSLVMAGVHLLAATLATVRDSGSRLEWPASVTRDSISFTIRLHTPIFSSEGIVTGPRLDRLEPLFQVMQPWIEEALLSLGKRGPVYPRGPKSAGVSGKVTITGVVDSAGRMQMATMRDIRPDDEPPPTGRDAEHYSDFVRSVRDFLSKAKFAPARIGGCPVRSGVQQSFEFRLGR